MHSFKSMRELQAELRKRKAPVAGKKDDLIKRLEAYDRNRNFRASATLDPLEDPLSDTFNDMNADSPLPFEYLSNISQNEVQEYFQSCNTKPTEVLCESPIAATQQEVHVPRRRLNASYNPVRESDIMNNYDDYVRNLAIGYAATTKTTMPLLQLYKPANRHGIEWDHTYTIKENEQEN